jgi:DNA-binding Lrp family transcriptional regulator
MIQWQVRGYLPKSTTRKYMSIKEAAFSLIRTDLDALKVRGSVARTPAVEWAANVYGPHQIVAFSQSESEAELVAAAEDLRSRRFIVDLDVRRVKVIPHDDELTPFQFSHPHRAVLLINVDYEKKRERDVCYTLRGIKGVVYARTMWGPADIVALVEGQDHETLRNLICDEIKVSTGVKSNTTLYCYPPDLAG